MSSRSGFADTRGVGRTNYVILGIGAVTCIVLSLLMQHFLRVKSDRSVPPIVSELTQNYGARLVEPSRYHVARTELGNIGTLTIHPMLGIDQPRLVHAVGQYVWRRIGVEERLHALIVECDTGFGERSRYQVASPDVIGPSVTPLRPDQPPSVRHDRGRSVAEPATGPSPGR
jgi:hypothetical protein